MKKEKRKYSEEAVQKWSEYLKNDHTLMETSEHFNVPYYSLVKVLVRYGYRKKSRTVKTVTWKKNVDISYFENIDSYEKAYFLGFIYADGSISSNINSGQKVFNFALQLQDKYILENLHKAMGLKTNIYIHKNSARLNVYDYKLYDDLAALGVLEDKSHKEFNFPHINEKYISSFILGYFDGDGCITIKKNQAGVSITCNSELFLKEMEKYLTKNNINCYIRRISKSTGYLFVLYISGKESHLKFRDFIYKNYSDSLIRKRDKFFSLF